MVRRVFSRKYRTIAGLNSVESNQPAVALRSYAVNFVVQFDQLSIKGNFDRVDIVTALTTHKGNVDLAFQELNGLQQQQFLHQVWNKQPEEEEAPPPQLEKNVDMEVQPQ